MQVVSVIAQAMALLTVLMSFSEFIQDKGRAAKALQAEVEANVLSDIGRLEFERAEQDHRIANADASWDAVTVGLAVIILLLGGIAWLLADTTASLHDLRASGSSISVNADVHAAESAPTPVSLAS